MNKSTALYIILMLMLLLVFMVNEFEIVARMTMFIMVLRTTKFAEREES